MKQMQKSVKKTKYYGRDALIEPDAYYKVVEENVELKKQVHELTDKVKKLETALRREKGTQKNPNSEDLDAIEIENRTLKSKITKMKYKQNLRERRERRFCPYFIRKR